MGVCDSSPHGDAEYLDKRLKDDKRKDALVHKLLLLGAGESGKSTLFKQMTTIYGKGFSLEERKKYKKIIHSNTIIAMQSLIKGSKKLVAKAEKISADLNELSSEAKREHELAEFHKCETKDEKVQKSKKKIMQLKSLQTPLTKNIAEMIKSIWKDPSIQQTFKFRGRHYSLPDSAPYFFERAEETWKEDYVPDLQDVLRSRVRTLGILEQKYEYQKSQFNLFDVGGQRNERKKWIHLFQNVTAVIFVAGLSAYDQLLYEDKGVNRMHESIRLFEEICNLRWFSTTNIILFLNKSDLFEDKLPHASLKVNGERVNAIIIFCSPISNDLFAWLKTKRPVLKTTPAPITISWQQSVL
mmetsp:Transcript_28322/g.68973  ORF Transcript_28322/g.68973 Transcript_28322/m.68973 type:complete len:355 (-) Transcript_28322:533-1597(-)